MSGIGMEIEDENRGRLSGRGVRVLVWLVALLVFELTADPALVVLVGCSKFGWDQLLAARWLRRMDPDRARGRACRWFYASWGLWRISIVATVLMFVVVFAFEGLRSLLAAPRKPGNHPPIQFLVAILIALVGFLLSTLTSVIGVISAWRGKVRVWVGDEGIAAWKSRQWPPSGHSGRGNRVDKLLFTAVPFGFVAILLPPILMLLTAISHIGRPGLAFVVMFVAMLGGVATLMWCVDFSKKRMSALSPEECWRDRVELRASESS